MSDADLKEISVGARGLFSACDSVAAAQDSIWKAAVEFNECRNFKETNLMNNGPTLSSGATGQDVRRLQRILVMIKLLDFTHITGTYGAQTVQAVKDFQSSAGLTVDGVAEIGRASCRERV